MSVIKNKIALITGGASGLGFIYAKQLLRNGLRGVTLADIDAIKGEKAISDITNEFGENKAIFIKLDVVNKKDFEDAMKKTVEVFGNFDILINNAGIMDESIYEKVIDINLKGTVNGSILAFEEYLPKYKSESSEPIIVNISSIAGLGPFFPMPVYCATKHAIISISKVLAMSENHDSQRVKILTMCPGPTDTPILHTVETKAFTPRLAVAFKELNDITFMEIMQQPEDVGLALIRVIENGENGSIWVIEKGILSEIEVPNQKDMKIIIS